MANLIATEGYAKNIGGKNISYTPNLGCTKSRAIALGCNVKGTYLNNLLVCLKDLSKADMTVTMHTYISPDYYYLVSISIDGINENNETLYFSDLYYPTLEVVAENGGLSAVLLSVDLREINNNSYFATFGNIELNGTLSARFTCRVNNDPTSQIKKEVIEYWT